jgi:hypothetical protein
MKIDVNILLKKLTKFINISGGFNILLGVNSINAKAFLLKKNKCLTL